jgi:ADP-dependent NAD(P)H-hydrate dehydratase / NAD(P)H-hydrate epimerase
MTKLLTAAQMRAIEAAAIASGEVTGLELMERAGRGVVEAVFAEWPELQAGSFKAVVLCGPGNNGGDGFVVARLLKERGWDVEVFLFGDAEKLPPDARVNYVRSVGMGEVRALTPLPDFDGARLLVDALFGTGLTRALPQVVDGLIAERRRYTVDTLAVCAIDMPSGLCSDSGRRFGTRLNSEGCLMADLTVTFEFARVGHYCADGPAASGKIVVKSIGLDHKSAMVALGGRPNSLTDKKAKKSAVVQLIEGYLYTPAFKQGESILDKSHGGHKFTHGHALILSGGPGKGGAARMTARGALRIGAGLVTLGVPPAALQENAARLDAVMLRSLKDADALSAWLHEDDRINALCIGPGFGTTTRHADFVEAVLETKRAAVLDADALTLLAQDKARFGKLHPKCVLTPHAGEFARLFPDIAARLAEPATKGPAYSKVDATREAAAQAGCVVLYKGTDTVIAEPQGRCSINSAQYGRAAPWLATAGSGDVLAGFITGLLARGFAPMRAAETASWLHVECARSFGPGLISEDLADELPKVFRVMGL